MTERKKKKNTTLRFVITIITVVVFNIIMLTITVFLLQSLPKKAEEIKKIRSLETKGVDDITIVQSEIQRSLPKVEKLESLFPDERELLSFVNKIDELKRAGIVTDFSFVSNDVIKDKLGFSGIPFAIEFTGSWSDVQKTVDGLFALPYFIRTIRVEAKATPESETIIYKYGGFLYVNENFYQNR